MMKLVTHTNFEIEYVGLSEAGNEAMYLSQVQGKLEIGHGEVVSDGRQRDLSKFGYKSSFPSKFNAYPTAPSLSSGWGEGGRGHN